MQLPKRSDYNYMIHMYYCTAYNHIRYPIHKNYLRDSDTYVSSSSLPENIRSRTRGTAQKIVGFSTPISSTSSLTSCDKEVNSQDRPKSKITKRYSGEHTDAYPTPESDRGTMENKQLLHNTIKDVRKRKVRHVNIAFCQLKFEYLLKILKVIQCVS